MTDQTPPPPQPDPARDVVTRETRRAELAALQFDEARGRQLFNPRSGQELTDLANLMASAKFMVKDIYRNNPGDCMALIAILAPYGLNPLQCSWKTFQTKPDAPIAYEAQLIVAMINASGALEDGFSYTFDGAGETRKVTVSGKLPKWSAPKTVETPPLSQINPKNSPLWKSDPDQQLAYYGGRAWVRRYKPEMLLGIYDTDEEPAAAYGPDHARDVTPQAPRRGGAVYREIDPPQPEPEVEDVSVVEAVVVVGEANHGGNTP